MTPEELRSRLKALGMTQRRFAADTGMAVSTVNRWCKGGAPIPKWVASLTDAYQIILSLGKIADGIKAYEATAERSAAR